MRYKLGFPANQLAKTTKNSQKRINFKFIIYVKRYKKRKNSIQIEPFKVDRIFSFLYTVVE